MEIFHAGEPPATAPWRVLCATRYGTLGASSRLRIMQYLPALQNAGFEINLRPFLANDYLTALYSGRPRLRTALSSYRHIIALRNDIQTHDLIWIEKELLPWVPYWFERGLLGTKPYILDFDDAWALRYTSSPSYLTRLLLRHKFSHLLRRAALTVVANKNLHDWAKSEGAKAVLQLPTVVDLTHYPARPTPSGPFTIGWIGTPLTATYLETIAAPLRQLAQEAPLKLLVIGAPNFCLPGINVEALAWSEASESQLLTRCHVGIMPLPESEWAQGKSGYKLIQYMALAKATVGSAIGANNQIISHGETGFLAHTEADWLTSLSALRDNPDLAQRLGQAGRQRAASFYSLEATAPQLVQAFNGLADNIALHTAKTRPAMQPRSA